jgi:hypothetical protein
MGAEEIAKLPVEGVMAIEELSTPWLPPVEKALFVAREYGVTAQRI